MQALRQGVRSIFDGEHGAGHHLAARWLFLRGLGLIYVSAFLALAFQARGLIGFEGILPASSYLSRLHALGALRFWYAPTLLWFSSGDRMLMAITYVGLVASVLAVINVWPRLMLTVCFACFLSFVSAAQDFSQYQSDGMLLEAGFLSLFLAPRGVLPGLGRGSLPSKAAVFLLMWEWFRIYFESGVVKLISGDPTWRNFTAMYEYYQNGPLPTWVGWYLQHMPPWFHQATAMLTLAMELVLVWMALLPGRWRVACFCVVTLWQVGVIATANYAFLNYLVLLLGVFLLEDRFVFRALPNRWKDLMAREHNTEQAEEALRDDPGRGRARGWLHAGWVAITAVILTWIGYATTALMVAMLWRGAPLPMGPVTALEPFRIANQYGLFANMTPHRYEIEFQGSEDGVAWKAYGFRFKPQEVQEKPGIYAPYQPRFDWNLWFASLGSWQNNVMVVFAEERLLMNKGPVLELFRMNPFADHAPRMVRTVLWQYWFSSEEEKRTKGVWWRRTLLGTYSPTLERNASGGIVMTEGPTLDGPPAP